MLELREYQRDAIKGIYDWFETKEGNPLVVIPTAGGKSLIIADFLRGALESYPGTRVLILTHVKELIEQNYKELIGIWPDAPAGIYSAGLGKRDIGARILFAGIQSIHSKSVALQMVDLILVDEAHLIPRSGDTMYGKFIGQMRQINPDIKIVGFTATHYRQDSGMLHEGKDALFDGIAYEISVRELIEQGYLAPPTTKPGRMPINTAGVKTVMGDFAINQLELAALDPATVASNVADIVAHGHDRKGWLVFGTGIDHCNMLMEGIQAAGISCEAIYGNTPSADRRQIIAAFKRQSLRCLVSMAVLTTGFNAQHVDLLALVRPTKSVSLYVQMVGRGTRLFPGKTDCLVLDFGGNVERHGPIDAPRVRAPKDGEGEMPEKQCRDRELKGVDIVGCFAYNMIAARNCIRCGEPFPFESKVDARPVQGAILTSHVVPEWVDVENVRYALHEKAGSVPTLRVTYGCGWNMHREWICLGHSGWPRQKAVRWWHERSNSTTPDSAERAIDHVSELRQPVAIQIRKQGKFFEILGYRFNDAAGSMAA